MEDLHYGQYRPQWLRWLPARCSCGRRRCAIMRRQEQARHAAAHAGRQS